MYREEEAVLAAVLVEVWVDPANLPGWKRGVVCSAARLVEREDGTFELGVDSRQGHLRFAGFVSMVTAEERRG